MHDQAPTIPCPAGEGWPEDAGRTGWLCYRGPDIPLVDIIQALATDTRPREGAPSSESKAPECRTKPPEQRDLSRSRLGK